MQLRQLLLVWVAPFFCHTPAYYSYIRHNSRCNTVHNCTNKPTHTLGMNLRCVAVHTALGRYLPRYGWYVVHLQDGRISPVAKQGFRYLLLYWSKMLSFWGFKSCVKQTAQARISKQQFGVNATSPRL